MLFGGHIRTNEVRRLLLQQFNGVLGTMRWRLESVLQLNAYRSRSLCCRPSVRLSITLVYPTQAVVIFGNISTAFGTLAIVISTKNFTDIVSGEPLHRGS